MTPLAVFLLTVLSLLLFGLGSPLSPNALASVPRSPANYYVDCERGDDGNEGTSEQSPWRSLARVSAHVLQPGDTVYLKRGCTFDGGLALVHPGTEGHPITIRPYGDGPRPILRNPGAPGNLTDVIRVNADWIVLQDLLVRDAQNAGVTIARGVRNIVVWNLEITRVGIGIAVRGTHNAITRNYVHDLSMVLNTPGGKDDYGAVGIWLFASDNSVTHNRLINCKAPSYDFGVDGGAVEWWGDADRNVVMYNWAQNCAGFLEMGGGTIRDTLVAYNVSINNDGFAGLHLGNQFRAVIERLRLENNTVVELASGQRTSSALNFMWADPNPEVVSVRNNIFYLSGLWRIASRPGFFHERNLYHLATSDAQLGFEPGEGDIVGDPQFKDLDSWDLSLQRQSPAIGAGLVLNHARDIAGSAVPVGRQPCLGAYEYQPPTTPPPTATASPTATPSPTATRTPTPLPSATPFAWSTVVDDLDQGFSQRAAQDPWIVRARPDTQSWHDQYHYNHQVGTGEDVATWWFRVPRRGVYAVYAWWWAHEERPPDVPYTIYHAQGATVVRVDQRQGGGRWMFLGRFTFDREGVVRVSDDASEGTGVVADAVRVVFVAPDVQRTPVRQEPMPSSYPVRRWYLAE
ncbi:MAG: golvesin C-terminal-like domain-containing protein [Anaerolineae bacterium]